MALKKAKILKWWGKVFILALFVVWIVRTFFVQSYSISSSQMEGAIMNGEKVLVDKTSYGIRMPSTILSIPFTFDSFFCLKSYSDLLELGYHRFFLSRISPNDIVLFNNPAEKEKPFDKRALCISRCVAVPGDTIVLNELDFIVNGKKQVSSPDLLLPYFFNIDAIDTIGQILTDLNISMRDFSKDSLYGYSVQSKYEAFLLNERLPDSLKLTLKPDNLSLGLIVPAKGMTISITDNNRAIYTDVIKGEVGDSDLNIDKMDSYTFKYDYYWFLSDNSTEGFDSRTLGFISEKYIIGKAVFVWYSSENKKSK